MSIEFAFQYGQIAICSDRGFIKIKQNNGALYRLQNALVNLNLAITAELRSAAVLMSQSANIFEANFYTYILQRSFS